MRTAGRRRKQKLGIFELQAQRKRAEEKKQLQVEKRLPEESAEDDIEIVLGSDEESQELPKKSPRKSKQQTASTPKKQLIGSPLENKVLEANVTPQKTPAKAEQPKSRPPGAKKTLDQADTPQRRTPRKARKKLDLGPGTESEVVPKPSTAQEVSQAANNAEEGQSSSHETEKPGIEARDQPELQQEQLATGLGKAACMLRERLVSPTGGQGPDKLQLRPSLLQVQHQVEQLLSGGIDNPGLNPSLLVIGPRGVGKTLALRRAELALKEKYNAEDGNPRIAFVHLSGLAHTDERLAFREIARQLCMTFGVQFSKTASTYDNQDFLHNILRETHRAEKVILFVLEEWDLFSGRSKQTLLYNLLDATMTHKMQAAVIGVSCRSDADVMLEKRLKSRFSSTRLLVEDPSVCSFDDDQEGPVALLCSLLSLRSGQTDSDAFTCQFNAAVTAAAQHVEVVQALQLLSDKGTATPRDLAQVAQTAVSSMVMEDSLLLPRHILSGIESLNALARCKVEAVSGLSVLELFLLAALDRLRRKGREVLNFEMAFDEYSSLRRGGAYRGVDETASRAAAFMAFQRLILASVVSYNDARAESRGGLKGFAPVVLLLTSEELKEGLQTNSSAPSVLLEWLTREAASAALMD